MVLQAMPTPDQILARVTGLPAMTTTFAYGGPNKPLVPIKTSPDGISLLPGKQESPVLIAFETLDHDPQRQTVQPSLAPDQPFCNRPEGARPIFNGPPITHTRPDRATKQR